MITIEAQFWAYRYKPVREATTYLGGGNVLAELRLCYQSPGLDVPLSHHAVSALIRMKEAGILHGREDGKYHGVDKVDRYEMAMALNALYRSLKG